MQKVWFITGANRGLGRAFVESALERGDQVAATSRNLQSVVDLSEKYGDLVLPLSLDITNREAVQKAVRQAKEHFGCLDVLVNNAGFGTFGAVEELSEQQLRQQFEVNDLRHGKSGNTFQQLRGWGKPSPVEN
ncbi:SDR family NAD(P)-dependent oxidoreductase [Granulicella cerasi]|uniref:SDR family NAD(P)-dependent oxidoreductase n=1 Tax=Granulicella cerasi TaxID=741063 RepID=UPI0021DFFE8B|nr:SDR family NAD(P)-dependent oxidoreductase [Granulicella cerasi]